MVPKSLFHVTRLKLVAQRISVAMSDKLSGSRRSFLKKAVVTTGITGSVLGNVQVVAAASQSLDVRGYADGSSYTISVNDPDAYGGTNLNSGDTVENAASESRLSGTVDDNDVDTFHFDGQVTGMLLEGKLDVTVQNPNGTNLGGDMTVEGNDNTTYSVAVTDWLSAHDDCEPEDDVNGDNVTGNLDQYDTDTYTVDGTIDYVSVFPGNSVSINHKI